MVIYIENFFCLQTIYLVIYILTANTLLAPSRLFLRMFQKMTSSHKLYVLVPIFHLRTLLQTRLFFQENVFSVLLQFKLMFIKNYNISFNLFDQAQISKSLPTCWTLAVCLRKLLSPWFLQYGNFSKIELTF